MVKPTEQRGAATLNEYQAEALEFAVYPGRGGSHGYVYPALGLAGEAGEVAEKIKKAMRDHNGVVDREALALELGDVLWYVAVLANECGLDLSTVAGANIVKLADRKARGAIKGEGDAR